MSRDAITNSGGQKSHKQDLENRPNYSVQKLLNYEATSKIHRGFGNFVWDYADPLQPQSKEPRILKSADREREEGIAWVDWLLYELNYWASEVNWASIKFTIFYHNI